ncbi:MAG: alpha-1,2-fucosyltransferase [Candidatus Methanoperedens sp.]|nr:alpha-1,2-fucosyltransferase [Candidatus Methanoperedens sp.]
MVIRLVGGLGNQMFQYAAAKAVALRSGTELLLDLSWFATSSDRQYALGPLRVSAQTIGEIPPEGATGRFLRKALYRLTGRTDECWQGRPVFREKHFHFDPAMLDVRAPVCLDGYFQSEKYFLEYRELIASEFTVVTPPCGLAQTMLEKMATHDAICLHVRRGDYVANATTKSFHGLCPLNYYYQGLRIVSEGLQTPHCYVFSDDPEWVRGNFLSELPMSIVDIHGPDEAHEDLRLMAACKHFVIANSSLSWWGAWLGSYPEKRVVAPKNWFQSSANDPKDLISDHWVRI